MDALRRNRLLIKELECEIGPRSKCMSPEYTNLQHLSVVNSDDSLAGPFPISFWRKIHDLRYLSKLELHNVTVTVTGSATFWSLCTRLEEIVIVRTTIGAQPAMDITFPRVQRFSLLHSPLDSYEFQVDWLCRCSNLTSLEWSVDYFLMDDFNAHLSAGTWVKLSELKLHARWSILDDQLDYMINSVKAITILELYDAYIEVVSFNALRRHFPFLRHLNVFQGQVEFMSTAMVLEVLASCPRLEYFHMGKVVSLHASTMADLHWQDWACTRSLRTLQVHFVVTVANDHQNLQRQFLGKISKFVNLENLHLDGQLNLQVGEGLELLAPLHKLRTLAIHTGRGDPTARDVE
ncbi:hypothetical protein BGX31_001570, partial [Mortierella sp. GBA43]